jgi:hypothetical protein
MGDMNHIIRCLPAAASTSDALLPVGYMQTELASTHPRQQAMSSSSMGQSSDLYPGTVLEAANSKVQACSNVCALSWAAPRVSVDVFLSYAQH